MTGMAAITIHAPRMNFVEATMTSTTPVVDAPDGVDDHAPSPARLLHCAATGGPSRPGTG